MRTLSKVMAGVVTLAMSGGLVIGAAGIANAAYNPSAVPYPVDPNNVANLTIYNATTGAIVTSGTNATTLDNYYFVASSAFSGAKTKTAINGYLAEAGKAPGSWSSQGLSAATTYPLTTAPAPVNGFTAPVAKGQSTSTFASLATTYPNNAPATGTGSDFYQLYQVRLNTTFPTPASQTYAFADIKIDTTTGIWTQVSPSTPPVAPTVGAAPTAVASDTTATVTVSSISGATSYTVTASTGQVVTGAGPTFAFTGLTNGTPVTFNYTATNANGTSASSAASAAVTPKAAPLVTTTAVSLSGGPYDNLTAVTITASVTASSIVNSGTVTFTDNIDGVLGSAPVSSTGVTSISKKLTGTGPTKHLVTASYIDGATFANSTGTAIGFDVATVIEGTCLDPLSQCTENQFFQATVNNGSLVISTPYTATNPFNLGTLALNDIGTLLSATKPFGSSTIPAGPSAGPPATPGLQPKATDLVSAYAPNYAGVTIVDRRPGQLGWTANLNAGDFTSGTNKIDAHNLGFTGVTPAYIAGNALQSISTFQNPAAAGVAPGAASTLGVKGTTKFASAPIGASVGTVYVYGDMTLNAPTSTPAGVYSSTVTFTIV